MKDETKDLLYPFYVIGSVFGIGVGGFVLSRMCIDVVEFLVKVFGIR